jgi:hypothetical protein
MNLDRRLAGCRAAIFALLLVAMQAEAQDTGKAATHPHGEFQRAGAGFACIVDAAAAGANYVPSESDCLWMGSLGIGDPAAMVAARFGAPFKTLPQPGGAVARVFVLDDRTYFVATIAGERVVALQITGPGPHPEWVFDGVGLGMSTDQLVAKLGRPMAVEALADTGGELWSYLPFPFSIELTGGKVTSIRIADEAFF